ncbi:AraC family transcriptional regulator [Mesorhizobium sp. M0220]|uniref:AraC family transcriptional regulator n=1 Tax=Mesorhizobium sp. M0220 TaxID=2956920 RepID=UPI003338DF57
MLAAAGKPTVEFDLVAARCRSGNWWIGCRSAAKPARLSYLVLLLRAWIEHQPLGTGGWFGALRDKGISRALRLIHERPGDPWTVASLADGAAQSRATFARRFTQLIGEPPLSYVTRWRMDLAAKALQETNQTIHEIGRAV